MYRAVCLFTHQFSLVLIRTASQAFWESAHINAIPIPATLLSFPGNFCGIPVVFPTPMHTSGSRDLSHRAQWRRPEREGTKERVNKFCATLKWPKTVDSWKSMMRQCPIAPAANDTASCAFLKTGFSAAGSLRCSLKPPNWVDKTTCPFLIPSLSINALGVWISAPSTDGTASSFLYTN